MQPNCKKESSLRVYLLSIYYKGLDKAELLRISMETKFLKERRMCNCLVYIDHNFRLFSQMYLITPNSLIPCITHKFFHINELLLAVHAFLCHIVNENKKTFQTIVILPLL